MDFLKQLSIANAQRDEKVFHHFGKWQPVDWSNAIAGEVGELCNLVKKMKRLNIEADGLVKQTDLENEVADILIYLDIFCQTQGIDIRIATVRKFNAVSLRYNTDIFLHADDITYK